MQLLLLPPQVLHVLSGLSSGQVVWEQQLPAGPIVLPSLAEHPFDSPDMLSEAVSCSAPAQQLDATAGVGTNVFTENMPAKIKPPARSKTITTRPIMLFVLKRTFISSPS